MTVVRVELEGAEQLNKALNQMGKRVAGKITRRAVRESAKPIKKAAQAGAPVETGLLRRKMRIRKFKTRRKDIIAIGVMTGKRVNLGIPGDAKYYYPAAIEYGTRTMWPNPFMARALASQRANSLRILQRLLWQGIRQGFLFGGAAA